LETRTPCKVNIYGYTWGTTTFYSPSVYGKPIPDASPGSFDRILINDCLWLRAQHLNLVKTILHYLSASQAACALVIAGFHTGRNVVRDFFSVATGHDSENETDGSWGGAEDEARRDNPDEDEEEKRLIGSLRAVEIFEVDVNGLRREWQPQRPGESKEMSKRWVVCAVLVKR